MRPGEQSKNLRMSVIVVVVAEYFFSVAVHARTLLAVVPVFYGSGADGPAPRVWILSAGRHRSFESDSSHSTNAVGAWTAFRNALYHFSMSLACVHAESCAVRLVFSPSK
jgi:hypothetical protein